MKLTKREAEDKAKDRTRINTPKEPVKEIWINIRYIFLIYILNDTYLKLGNLKLVLVFT